MSTPKIVKAQHAGNGAPEPAKVVDRDVFNAQERARAILAEANEQSQAMLKEAERRSEQLAEQAHQRGYRDGLAIWQQRCLDLLALYNRTVAELRPQVHGLALDASRKILRHHLEEVPEAIQGSIEVGLQALRDASPSRLEVTLHPEDLPAVEGLLGRLGERDPRWAAMVLRPDPTMERGGCRLASDFGEVDASVETQVEAMRLLLEHGEGG